MRLILFRDVTWYYICTCTLFSMRRLSLYLWTTAVIAIIELHVSRHGVEPFARRIIVVIAPTGWPALSCIAVATRTHVSLISLSSCVLLLSPESTARDSATQQLDGYNIIFAHRAGFLNQGNTIQIEYKADRDGMEPRWCHAENNYWAALIRAHDLVIRAHELLIRACARFSNPCARISNPCARINYANPCARISVIIFRMAPPGLHTMVNPDRAKFWRAPRKPA